MHDGPHLRIPEHLVTDRLQEVGDVTKVSSDRLARQVDVAVDQPPFHSVGRRALEILLAGGFDDEAGFDAAPSHYVIFRLRSHRLVLFAAPSVTGACVVDVFHQNDVFGDHPEAPDAFFGFDRFLLATVGTAGHVLGIVIDRDYLYVLGDLSRLLALCSHLLFLLFRLIWLVARETEVQIGICL